MRDEADHCCMAKSGRNELAVGQAIAALAGVVVV